MHTKSLGIFNAIFLSSVALFLSARPAVAQPVATLGPPPQIFIVQAYDETEAKVTLTQTVIRHLPVTEVRINAAGVEETVTVLVAEQIEQLTLLPLAEDTVRTVGGKQLDRKEAAKALNKGQPVIMLGKGKKLAAGYNSLFRDEVIILEIAPDKPELAPAKEPVRKVAP